MNFEGQALFPGRIEGLSSASWLSAAHDVDLTSLNGGPQNNTAVAREERRCIMRLSSSWNRILILSRFSHGFAKTGQLFPALDIGDRGDRWLLFGGP